MKQIQVTIKGTTPLLMNSPKAMLEPTELIKRTTTKRDPKIEAEKVAYRSKKGKLYVPSTAVKGTIINAAAWKKAGKYALRPLIASAVRIKPIELILNQQEYEIDLRTVVIQRKRIVKARPVIDKWELDFDIVYNDQIIADPELIKTCLEEAGERVGILDFRPQKLGEFGCFVISKWEVMNNGN